MSALLKPYVIISWRKCILPNNFKPQIEIANLLFINKLPNPESKEKQTRWQIHVKCEEDCYSLFTNEEKLERPRSFCLNNQDEGEPESIRRRFSLRIESNTVQQHQPLHHHNNIIPWLHLQHVLDNICLATSMSTSLSNMLPKWCLIFKKTGPIFVKKVGIVVIFWYFQRDSQPKNQIW